MWIQKSVANQTKSNIRIEVVVVVISHGHMMCDLSTVCSPNIDGALTVQGYFAGRVPMLSIS